MSNPSKPSTSSTLTSASTAATGSKSATSTSTSATSASTITITIPAAKSIELALPTEVVIAEKTPCGVDMEKDQEVYWCKCGRSKDQPFCDSSHSSYKTKFEPVKFVADKTKKYVFCRCKLTKKPPFCDGSHKILRTVQPVPNP